MTITKRFKSVERKFVLTIIALAILSVGILSFSLYQTNTVTFSDQVTSSELNELISDDPAVVEYLEQEKDFEAHFITIANLVKNDQQRSLGQSMLIVIGPVIALVGVIGYLTARFLLRPVRESYESQERFMQDAAHELRNPLTSIIAALQSSESNQRKTDLFTAVSRQTKRLIGIVEDLLFLERRQSGGKVADTNISELLLDVLEDLQPAITAKKLKLTQSISPGIMMQIDPQDFVKVAKNIISNSIKYSKPNKKLAVDLNQSNHIELIVTDQGIGIPEDELGNIGERFYRAKNVGNKPGTGLGIAIVQKVLNVYGGSIDIASKRNKGTTVSIKF